MKGWMERKDLSQTWTGWKIYAHPGPGREPVTIVPGHDAADHPAPDAAVVDALVDHADGDGFYGSGLCPVCVGHRNALGHVGGCPFPGIIHERTGDDRE